MTDDLQSDEIRKRLESQDPWIRFIIKNEGSEVGAYWGALRHSIEAACSANEHDHAERMLDMLDQLIGSAWFEAKSDGWIHEMAAENQVAFEAWALQFEHPPMEISPMEELRALLKDE